MSLSASVRRVSAGSKLGGATPGIPPPPADAEPVSHTSRLPLPAGCVLCTWRSGRPPPPLGCNTLPTAAPLSPGAPSTTITNCPLGVSTIWRPAVSNWGVGVGVELQLELQQNTHPSKFLTMATTRTRGPGPTVIVGVADRVGLGVMVGVRVGVPLTVGVPVGPVCVGVQVTVGVPVADPVAVAVPVAVRLGVGPGVPVPAVGVGVGVAPVGEGCAGDTVRVAPGVELVGNGVIDRIGPAVNVLFGVEEGCGVRVVAAVAVRFGVYVGSVGRNIMTSVLRSATAIRPSLLTSAVLQELPLKTATSNAGKSTPSSTTPSQFVSPARVAADASFRPAHR